MTTVGAFEAKTHFSDLLRRVEQGESFRIQRRGKTVAALTGATGRRDADDLQATLRFFRELRERTRATTVEVAGWREEGRR